MKLVEPVPFIAWHPIFNFPLPPGHRFPMVKYELLHDQLLYEGVVIETAYFMPGTLEEKYILPVHKEDYFRRLVSLRLSKQEIRRIGFPLSQQLIERELRIARGTVTAAETAIKNKIGFNIAGGTHHAGSNWGEGFCMLNDQAIAARYLLDYENVGRILIIDLDVHQGNGTAEIFQHEKRVFTFSMHGRNNFPFHKEKSDVDVGLEDETSGDKYLTLLGKNLDYLFKIIRPDFIFFQAGADVIESDKMGKLKLTIEDCKTRDKLVFEYCKNYHVPVEVSMGGGYSASLKDIVDTHCNTFKEGISILLD